MISEILPAVVASAEAFGDPPDAALFPAEEALIARAVPERRTEFATGRHCARTALGALGHGAGADPAGPGAVRRSGRPGIVGSITHCAGYRAAAVARASEVITIGLDAEPAQWLPAEVLGLVALPDERDRLRDLARRGARRLLGPAAFQRQGIRLQGLVSAGPPLARLCRRGYHHKRRRRHLRGAAAGRGARVSGVPPAGFTGRWIIAEGMILTAITVLA